MKNTRSQLSHSSQIYYQIKKYFMSYFRTTITFTPIFTTILYGKL